MVTIEGSPVGTDESPAELGTVQGTRPVHVNGIKPLAERVHMGLAGPTVSTLLCLFLNRGLVEVQLLLLVLLRLVWGRFVLVPVIIVRGMVSELRSLVELG